MKFCAQRTQQTVFPGVRALDFKPVTDGVRLRTCGGRFVTEHGEEKTWQALWDTGAIVTVIPAKFAGELGLPPVNYTRPLRAYDGSLRRHVWYPVLIGLPGLPLFGVRAVAPDDPDPDRPRTYVTLGRDLLVRLVIRCSSNVPWDYRADPADSSEWFWGYRRSFPRGLADLLK